MQDTMFVGPDVHKATLSVACAARGGGVRCWGGNTNRADHVRKLVEKLVAKVGQLHFCCEAGPCGCGLYRQLTALGHACDLVAPPLFPVRSGDRVKTDRRDAAMLAKLHRASAPSVSRRVEPGEWRSSMSSAARRSARPSACVRSACTTRPLRFSIRVCPMKQSVAPAPGDFSNSRTSDQSPRHVSRWTASRLGSRLRRCGIEGLGGSSVLSELGGSSRCSRAWAVRRRLRGGRRAPRQGRRPCRAGCRRPSAGSSSSRPRP